MKVLWICNIMLPIIAEHLQLEASNKEGWLSGLCGEILKHQKENKIELYVAFPVSEELDGYREKLKVNPAEVTPGNPTVEGSTLYCYGFYEDVAHAEQYDEALEDRLLGIWREVQPDVVHCFGTEYAHTLAMVRCCPNPERVLVGIQGICQVIAKAYMADLPKEIQQKVTFRDWLKKDSMLAQQQKFAKRGEREREIFRLAGNVTGRTEFDRSYVLSCNEKLHYFSMNETLRSGFYEGQWEREKCAQHQIFMSQGDYPLKGLHYMLLAVSKLREKYPDIKLCVAGNSLVNYHTLKDKIKISAYGNYLRNLVTKNQLEDKVEFLGRLTEAEMKQQYLQSGLYVCASSNENSPNSLGEAMLLGVPCVAAKVGGIPSLFVDGVDGILYDGYELDKNGYNNMRNKMEKVADNIVEAISEIWNQPQKTDDFCENARLHARKTHDRDANYYKMTKIYAEIAVRRSAEQMAVEQMAVEQTAAGMKICFVSNYINHHQIPFCDAMANETGGDFRFIQTQPMERERVQMGWQEQEQPEYVLHYYEQEQGCREWIRDSDVVLFGGCDDESYIQERLQASRLIVRISERLYKTGQWKAVSPKGLLKKYKDHTRYRKAPVYLLCAGAYVASDFHIVRAYPKKMFCWGYFPQAKHYDLDKLLEQKGCHTDSAELPSLLWAGRFIDWKHPELALKTARYLKQKGLAFHLDMVGGGALEAEVKALLKEYELEDYVSLLGFRTPVEVRSLMEKADIFLFTSDRQEGWGAVANEAMNSGCALVADHMIGAVPYLIQQGENGYIYRDGKEEMLFDLTEKLLLDKKLRQKMGKAAYETITQVWNAENAARQLMKLLAQLQQGEKRQDRSVQENDRLQPCVPAPIIGESGKRCLL